MDADLDKCQSSNHTAGGHPSRFRLKFRTYPGGTATQTRKHIERGLGTRQPTESIHRVLLLRMMRKIPLHGQETLSENLLLQQAQENAAFFAKFKPGFCLRTLDLVKRTNICFSQNAISSKWNLARSGREVSSMV